MRTIDTTNRIASITIDQRFEKNLNELPAKVQANLLRKIEMLQKHGNELKFPHTRHVRGELRELRSEIQGVCYRMLYFMRSTDDYVLVLLAIKKEQKLREQVIRTAMQRVRLHKQERTNRMRVAT